MLLISLIALAHAGPPDLDQKVSIEIHGGTGKDMAVELTRKTGITFETNDAATVERYVIHIENQPLREAMERIADAEHGEWIKINNSYQLRRSPSRVAETIAAHRAVLARGFQKTLDDYRKQIAAKPDFSDEAAHDLARKWQRLGPNPNYGGMMDMGYWEKQNALQQAIPVGRAFMRIMLTFSARQLAELPVDEPAVYSTHPTAMQRELPDAALATLGDLVSEQSIWEEAVAKYLPDFGDQPWNGMGTNGKMRDIATAVLSMQRWDESSGVQAHLMLADAKDRVVAETYLFVQPGGDGNPPPARATAKKAEPRIPLSAVDIALAMSFGREYGDRSPTTSSLSDAARAILSNPEKGDPLSTFVADGLIGVARARHENLAAVVDDRAISACAQFISKEGMDATVLDGVRGWGVQSVVEGQGWLVLAEQRPDRADEVRCNRTDLHKMLDTAVAQGRLHLDDAAAYALAEPHFYENPIPVAYLTALVDSMAGRTLEQNDRNLLRFYGSLDPNQRANSEHLSLAGLTSFQLILLEKMVYGSNANLQQTMTEPQQADEAGEIVNYWNTLAREPTCSLGDGIPRTGYAKITAKTDRAILAHMHYGQWDQGLQAYDVRQLGWMMAAGETQADNVPWTVVGMRPADRTEITFLFQYTEKLSQNLTLQDVLATGKESAFMEQLPGDLRSALQAQINESKKQIAEGGQQFYYRGGAGGNGPP